MKEIVLHPVYGEIVYNEDFWSGKKTLTVNGVPAQTISKKAYMIGDKQATLKGTFFMGVSLCIEDETIQVSPKPKWYEFVLSVLSFLFLVIWGNNPALCAIFPVVGGGIGGGLGGLSFALSLLFMKKQKTLLHKLLVGIGIIAITIFIAFILALVFMLMILWLNSK